MTTRNVRVDLKANVAQYISAMKAAGAATGDLHDRIDKTNDRTAWLAQGILALVPAVTTLGAGAVPVISGLVTQMTVGGAAAGAMALAFNGVGDALSALNDYQLEPTAANLEDLQQKMAKIGPEGEEFVRFLDSLGPQFASLSDTARGGMFPGIAEGISEFMALMPQLHAVVGQIAEGVGEVASSIGSDLASDEWADFFMFLETDAKPTLIAMSNTLGNFAQGLGSMMVAFGPLSADFSAGFEDMSRSFADWAAGLDESRGFQEFLDYVREAAPLALDFLASLSMAFVELAKAASVIGPSALKGLTAMLDLIGALLDTPLGPVIVGFTALTSAWGRLNAVAAITGSGVLGKASGGFIANLKAIGPAAAGSAAGIQVLARNSMTAGAASGRMVAQSAQAKSSLVTLGKSAGAVGGQVALLGVAMSGAGDKMGVANTVSLALAGSLMGPWGAAVGASAGLLLDMKAAGDGATDSLRGLSATVESGNLDRLKAQLADAKSELNDFKDTDWGSWSDIWGDATAGLSLGLDGVDMGEDEIAAAEAALRKLMAAEEEASTQDGMRRYYELETEAIRRNIAAMQAKRDEALRGMSAETNYAASLMDTKASLEENGRAWNLTTEAGINNRRAVERQAAAWNDLTRSSEQTPAAFRKAKAALVDSMMQMGASREEARRYARQLLDIPTSIKTKINAETDIAAQKVRGLQAQIDSLRDGYVTVHVNRVNTGGGDAPYLSGGARRAMGGPIYGPGTGTSDDVPIWASNGEYVIKAAAVQKYGIHMFDSLNAMKFAGGGQVGRAGVTNLDNLSLRELVKKFGSLEKALGKVEKATERNTKRRDQLTSARDSARSAAAGSFNGDLFGNGVAGLMLQLEADRNDAKAMRAALAKAKKKGLDGGLFQALAASGDLITAQQLAAGPASNISRAEAMYAQRAQAQRSLGSIAASPYNAAIRDLNKEMRELRETNRELRRAIKGLPPAVRDGAREGTERRERRQDKQTAARVR